MHASKPDAGPLRFAQVRDTVAWMSLPGIKSAAGALSETELTKLAAFIRQREELAWDRQIDADFAGSGRLRKVMDEVRADVRAVRAGELP